jgi:hypothetical protein
MQILYSTFSIVCGMFDIYCVSETGCVIKCKGGVSE